ncbi:MAG: uvrD [Candidatus Saccharibacteria bacterium]|nr:uvrD [Candidatus Saccharibacteria bacterium]
MDFNSRFVKLNTAQKQAVETIEGPIMVVAGPGTGKTELLSMRTANILAKTDTLAANILCLTFTDSGADAMRDRLISIIGQDAYKVAIHTFHSFGTEIINQNSEYFYNGATFAPAEELSSYEILRAIFDELDYTNLLASKMNGEYTYLKDAFMVISELKRSGLTSSELLAILDANEAVCDQIEKKLSTVFDQRISSKTLDQLIPIAQEVATLTEAKLPAEITPLSHVIAIQLAHSLNEAQTAHSTKPVTAWKNAWLEKDDSGAFVFKDRKRHVKLRAIAAIYDSYLAHMQEAELYDFDDMILQVVHTMETQPDLKFNIQEKYQYIMVDEFQDTNLAQARILHNLTDNEVNNGRPNIMVVGDDDQAIYSFQGADVSNILNFRQAYHDVTLITLTDNYRSAAPILNAAREVITQGSERLERYIEELDKSLTAHHEVVKPETRIVQAASRTDERQWLVDSIKHRIESGEAPSSIAVLARRHYEIGELLPYFAKAEVSVSYEKRENILDSDVLASLECLATIVIALHEKRLADADALLPELLSHPAWNITPENIWKLSLQAHTEHRLWLDIMSVMPELTTIHSWLVMLAQKMPQTPLEYMLDLLIGCNENETFRSPLYDYYFSEERLANDPRAYLSYLQSLRTIRAKLREYHSAETPSLLTFIEFIDLHRTTETPIMNTSQHRDTMNEAVNLMTAHKSKGLEFDTVYIVGAIDTSWGEKVRSRSRMISYPENLPLAPSGSSLDERLRLFFVAMTRAKKDLIISYASRDDSGKETRKASFLLASTVEEQVLEASLSLDDHLEVTKLEWYAPLVAPISGSMQDILTPQLTRYKLSATHLNNFLDVSRGGPHHFLLSNLLHFPSAMSPAAAYGSAIHAVLQRAHNHLKATREQKPQEDILSDFEHTLQEHRLPVEDYDSFLQRGIDALRAFFTARHDTFSPDQKVELGFSGQQVILGEARLTGALDLLDIDEVTRTIHVTDYKTGKASRSWQGKTDFEKIKLHKYKQQLMFYKFLIEHSRDYSNYSVVSASLQFVEPTRSGEIVSLDFEFDADECERLAHLIQKVWQHIIELDLPDISQFDPSFKGMLAFEDFLLDR